MGTLVFAGDIGENARVVRARICEGLEFLGNELDDKHHMANAGVISAAILWVAVRVIHTDEERGVGHWVDRVPGLHVGNECQSAIRKVP